MRKILVGLATTALIVVAVSGVARVAVADVWVDGYTRSDGGYVSGHFRTEPDGNPYNNYSHPNNYNPNKPLGKSRGSRYGSSQTSDEVCMKRSAHGLSC
ncbi:MAG: hypothetical protein MJE68_13470 [Proteobacteria bacterium]|nr:hypothetical protein [Pseudomonadota bacterium]